MLSHIRVVAAARVRKLGALSCSLDGFVPRSKGQIVRRCVGLLRAIDLARDLLWQVLDRCFPGAYLF